MTQTPLKKIEQAPVTLRNIVQKRMRDAIIEGHFKPGERLVERPLCDQLGVSRTVIRETIRYLEAEGLVEIMPNKGPIVAPLSQDDARQIYAIRRMLETSAAGACARVITPAIAKDLKAALKVLAGTSTKTDPGALFRATDAFYEVIFNGAGHQIAWEIVRRLNGRISRLRMMTLSTEDRTQPGQAHMTAICEAIVAGNPQAAREAVKRHIDDAAMIADRLLEDMNEDV